MSIGITNDHRHRHIHDERGHGGNCTCRSCRYDGSVGDLLTFRNNVERIASGGDDDAVGPGADPDRATTAPAGSPARTIERLTDEARSYAYHRGASFSVYA